MTHQNPHQFTPIKRAPAYLQVQRAIEADILSGSLAEGDLLPTESALCEQFGVTRSTVREGIRLLETSGLVKRGPAKRLVVCRPGSVDVALSTSRALTFSGVTFREAFEALALFQPQVAARAAQVFTEVETRRLTEVHAQLIRTAREDYEAVVAMTDAFFAAIADGFDNGVTTAMLASLNRLIEAGLRQVVASVPDARARILTAQHELISAIEAGDAEAARLWMSRHIDDLHRGFEVAGMEMGATLL